MLIIIYYVNSMLIIYVNITIIMKKNSLSTPSPTSKILNRILFKNVIYLISYGRKMKNSTLSIPITPKMIVEN